MGSGSTPGVPSDSTPMGWIWIGVFAVVSILLGFAMKWDELVTLLTEGKIGAEQAQVLGFVAGYTLPLTLGIAAVVFGLVQGWHRGHSPYAVAGAIAAVLTGTALIAQETGLGLLPDFAIRPVSGPPGIAQLVYVGQAYLNSYGWPLAFSSVAIGGALALQVHTWLPDSLKSGSA